MPWIPSLFLLDFWGNLVNSSIIERRALSKNKPPIWCGLIQYKWDPHDYFSISNIILVVKCVGRVTQHVYMVHINKCWLLTKLVGHQGQNGFLTIIFVVQVVSKFKWTIFLPLTSTPIVVFSVTHTIDELPKQDA